MPTQLSYDARGYCCYKQTILLLSWRHMIDQKEQQTQSLQQITIDTYTHVHIRAHTWHTSDTGFTCCQHCILQYVPTLTAWIQLLLSTHDKRSIIVTNFYASFPAIDCGDPGTPTNGQRSLSSTTYNSVATYTCDVGYTLQGPNSRTCQSDGLWSGSVPQCLGT